MAKKRTGDKGKAKKTAGAKATASKKGKAKGKISLKRRDGTSATFKGGTEAEPIVVLPGDVLTIPKDPKDAVWIHAPVAYGKLVCRPIGSSDAAGLSPHDEIEAEWTRQKDGYTVDVYAAGEYRVLARVAP